MWGRKDGSSYPSKSNSQFPSPAARAAGGKEWPFQLALSGWGFTWLGLGFGDLGVWGLGVCIFGVYLVDLWFFLTLFFCNDFCST